MKTIKRSKLSTIKMVAGEENRTGKVIDGDRLMEWVGIGWIEIRKATTKDRRTYPTCQD